MGVQRNVFASKAERNNYYKLSRQWGDKCRIYHNLPFLNVLNASNLFDHSSMPFTPITLAPEDFNRLKKTSIDYTLCDDTDAPLVSIEFDGLQNGYSAGTTYMPGVPLHMQDAWRNLIITLKLKVAYGSMFPFFVVGFDHFEDLGPDLQLTIVDGIIGLIFADKAKHERFAKGPSIEELGVTEEEYAGMRDDVRYETLTDWAIGVEVEADYENNPIYQRLAALDEETGSPGYSMHFLHYEPISDSVPLRERARLLDAQPLIGAEVSLLTTQYGEIKKSAWIPNLVQVGFIGEGLVEAIAQLLALTELARRIKTEKAVGVRQS